ncbi:MAG TPA: FAD-dependent thymidylate synthase [Terriglobales bacterium]|nr:FAD-dependent thymidylate synthase [Terriglobales bacterium]
MTPQQQSTEASTIEVFAVHGVDPEVQAYAMAKYSRSALSMKESLREINEQKAEKFLNTFYFQYGHRSIADLAHIAMAIEKLSILAAITLVDEQRWDGQERSTRYQDFRKGKYYVPDFGGDRDAQQLFQETVDSLFRDYEILSEQLFEYLRNLTPRPEDMKPDAYERTLRARAFDITRYLLPLATNTSLGQIVNARTLEGQISRLLSDPHPEIQHLGELLKQASRAPAWNVNQAKFSDLIAKLCQIDEDLARQASELLLREVRVAPTLVKYAEKSAYLTDTHNELRQAAAELMRNAEIQPARPVELLDPDPLEIELATTLLYEHCQYPYRQLRERVEALSSARREEVISMGTKHRGRHDELLRAFAAGQALRFDILMDIGGFRDMHRHRRCTQIGQEFTTAHGYDTPEEIVAAGKRDIYDAAMKRAAAAYDWLAKRPGQPSATESAQYVIPLAFRRRTLFKMDFAEAVYIAELRSKPEGHISYRRVAYAMYEEVARKHPTLAAVFRVKDVTEPVDLLKR